MRVRAAGICALGAAWLTGSPQPARAFDGFYVTRDGRTSGAAAADVVVVRDPPATVLTVRPLYAGAPEDLVLVVPAPAMVDPRTVRVVAADVLARLERTTAPRLDEYWEQDPCPTGDPIGSERPPIAATPLAPLQTGASSTATGTRPALVAELGPWLAARGYAVPPDVASPGGAPFGFVVLEVGGADLLFVDGLATLPALQLAHEADTVTLRTHAQDAPLELSVYVLAAGAHRAIGRPRADVPTSLRVADAARGRFRAFYRGLLDATVAADPRAVITEFTWMPALCDPRVCDVAWPDDDDLTALGAAELLPPREPGPQQHRWWSLRSRAHLEKSAPSRAASKLFEASGGLRRCHDRALEVAPSAGDVVFTLHPNGDGSVLRVDAAADTRLPRELLDCARARLAELWFQSGEGAGGCRCASTGRSASCP